MKIDVVVEWKEKFESDRSVSFTGIDRANLGDIKIAWFKSEAPKMIVGQDVTDGNIPKYRITGSVRGSKYGHHITYYAQDVKVEKLPDSKT
jgi:hypothetical protein